MYKSYKLLTFMLNTSGGESETVEHLYKEVMIDEKATLVPCTKEESIVKFYDKLSKNGGNKAVQAIKVMLFDDNGGLIKSEELIKPVAE